MKFRKLLLMFSIPVLLLVGCSAPQEQKAVDDLTEKKSSVDRQERQPANPSPPPEPIFGLKKGMSLEQVKALGFGDMEQPLPQEMSWGWFIDNPKKPEGVGNILFCLPPEHGLLAIHFIWDTGTINDDPYGDKTKRRFRVMRDSLAAKYGEGETVDRLKSGSRWSHPQHFARGILSGDRVLTWETEMNPDSNKWGLESVTVRTIVFEKKYVALEMGYIFDGWKDFRDTIKAEADQPERSFWNLFGLKRGMTPAEVRAIVGPNLKMIDGDGWAIKNPQNLADAMGVIFFISPKYGLLSALITWDIKNLKYRPKEVYSSLATSFDKYYGTGKRETSQEYFSWNRPLYGTKNKYDLENVRLTVNTEQSSKNEMMIVYIFRGYGDYAHSMKGRQ